MGPAESPTSTSKNQERKRRRRRRPRARICLLKGCGRRFRPESDHALVRYCSVGCREAAAEWSQWKARQKYRAKPSTKLKRSAESMRSRERKKKMKKTGIEPIPAVGGSAVMRVFRCLCGLAGVFGCGWRSLHQRFCPKEGRLGATEGLKCRARQKQLAQEPIRVHRKVSWHHHKGNAKSRNKRSFDTLATSAWGISKKYFKVHACDRPGCYESFVYTRRSPCQRFCTKECRQALERVLARERRWQEIRSG